MQVKNVQKLHKIDFLLVLWLLPLSRGIILLSVWASHSIRAFRALEHNNSFQIVHALFPIPSLKANLRLALTVNSKSNQTANGKTTRRISSILNVNLLNTLIL